MKLFFVCISMLILLATPLFLQANRALETIDFGLYREAADSNNSSLILTPSWSAYQCRNESLSTINWVEKSLMEWDPNPGDNFSKLSSVGQSVRIKAQQNTIKKRVIASIQAVKAYGIDGNPIDSEAHSICDNQYRILRSLLWALENLETWVVHNDESAVEFDRAIVGLDSTDSYETQISTLRDELMAVDRRSKNFEKIREKYNKLVSEFIARGEEIDEKVLAERLKDILSDIEGR